ncbi:MAG TPA: hypothetical protein VGT61_16595 [Thermomicrobiales bacterium]|jgi:hypothetical protein|nr:hypothetical protein [Thermomicrobiales bacterium]
MYRLRFPLKPHQTDIAGQPRRVAIWLIAIAVLILGGSPLALAARGPAPVPAAASADWLWMNGPVLPVQGARLQADDATPASLELGDDEGTPVADETPSGTPGFDFAACYTPDRQTLRAEDGTGATTGTPVGGTPVSGTPVSGTPVADDSGTSADLTLAGFPAGAAPAGVSTDVEAVVRAVAVCLSEGDITTLNELIGDDFRGQLLGSDDPISAEEFAGLASELPPTSFTIDSVSDVTITAEGDATATVRYLIGNQIRQGEWTLELSSSSASFLGMAGPDGVARASARWVVVSEQIVTPSVPEDAATLTVTLDEYEITVDPDSTDATTLAMEIRNEGEQDHEALVLRLEDGATTNSLLVVPGPSLPDGISVVGQLTVPAGEEATMVLQGLEPGDYAVVDLFLDTESSVPNLSLGMEASFEIED